MAVKSATNGFVWKTLEQYGVMGIQFILQLFLARILEPDVYGIVAIVMMFIAFSNVFIQKGFSTALVQRKEINNEDISSVFYVSMAIAAISYGLLFLFSPAIATFFNMPELTDLLRVMCLSLFPGVYSSIQNALLRRDINFKVVFFASTLSVAISGIVAIWMAYNGAGVWALAVQQLIYGFLIVFVMYYQCRWIPMLHFNLYRVKRFWAFGWKVLVTSLVDELFVELRTLIIGKMYMKADLSFYNRGRQFPNLLMNSINGSLQAVLLPRLSSVQDKKSEMSSMLRTSITTSYFVMLPLLVLLACSANQLIEIILTEKWLPCVPYLQLFCIYYSAWPFCTASSQAIYAIGRSDIILKLEIIRKVLDVVALLLSIHYGVIWIAASAVVVEIISMPLYIRPAYKLIGYSLRTQLIELFPVFLLSSIIGVAVIAIGKVGREPLLTLLCQLLAGISLYILLSLFFQRETISALFKRIQNIKTKNSTL